jgi:uncharacterized membrane protein
MKEIHTEIEINAPAEKVWRVLTDFAAYPEWNPFVGRFQITSPNTMMKNPSVSLSSARLSTKLTWRA